MITENLLEILIETPSFPQQKEILNQYRPILNEELAHLLRKAADEFLHSDRLAFSDQLADLLLYQGELMDDDKITALGWRVKGNAHTIGRGEFEQGISCYDRAVTVYEEMGLIDQNAALQAGKVIALASLGRYQDALDIYYWAVPILEAHEEWLRLGHLHMNIGSHVYGRQGKDTETLACFEHASRCYAQLGEDGIEGVAWITMNSANILRNQGKLKESLAYCHRAYEILISVGQFTEAARAQHIMAQAHILQGEYNDALLLLQNARGIFEEGRRYHDMILADLDSANCLLQLRRFTDVLDKCQKSRAFFEEQGVPFELGQSLLYAAIAHTHLNHYEEALSILDEAYRLFVQEESLLWATMVLLEKTTLHYQRTSYPECLALVQECLAYLESEQLPIQTFQAYLIGSRAAIALPDYSLAQKFLAQAEQLIQHHELSTLYYEYYHLQGTLAHAQGANEQALLAYEQAIDYLERLRGQIMVEFRAGFLTDKEEIYQDMVALCLVTDSPEKGLGYVERAKSRALIDLLSHRIDMSLQSRGPEDIFLIESLTTLRQKRDELYHSQMAEPHANGLRNLQSNMEDRQIEQELLTLEKEITDTWHQLLLQNADYAGDAALWQVRVEPFQSYLDSDTILLEYFVIRDELWLFVVTANQIESYRLPKPMTEVQKTLKHLWVNLNKTPSKSAAEIERWTERAQQLLQRLYDALIQPVQKLLRSYQHLYIVPHSSLHYLPFHALYDGDHYLVEKQAISYLPSASYLHYCQKKNHMEDCQVFAYSSGQQLPNTIHEAATIDKLLNAHTYTEEAATIGTLRKAVTNCGILHLATHGDFRADDPLFSGLVLEDGLLTTLDIFNLRFNSALVTLSACQTGRSIVGGGDELLGLSRAFLSAGASALLISMWAVEDRSTALLMEHFYQNFSVGETKNRALQKAQLGLMHHENQLYRHPYFWAPFVLIGNIEAP